MKKIITIIGLALAVSITARADVGFSVFSTPGTAVNGGTNWAIIPSQSKNGGEPIVTYLNVSGFAATAITLTGYVSTNSTTATAANTTTTNYVSSTNYFAIGDILVVQHSRLLPRFQCERMQVADFKLTNNLVTTAAPVNALAAGDKIYRETSCGTIPIVSSATTPREISNAAGILTGQRNTPFLLDVISGVGTNTINTVTATFVP